MLVFCHFPERYDNFSKNASGQPGRYYLLDIITPQHKIERAVASIHNVFIKNERIRMKVIILAAVTADGMIARNDHHFPDWSGRADKKLFKEITMKSGVVIMGSRTFDVIGKPLNGRKNIVMTRNKDRPVGASNLVFSNDEPAEIIAGLAGENYSQAVIAGGSIINTLFVAQELVDELHLIYSPVIFGKGIHLFTKELDLKLTVQKVENIGEQRLYVVFDIHPTG